LGFSYFFGAFLAGPQFSFQKFHQFLTHELYAKPEDKKTFTKQPPCLDPVLRCFFLGLFFMIITQIGSAIFPSHLLKTEEYYDLSFVSRVLYMRCSMEFCLMKYFGVWLMSEGICILTGIGFNGYEKDGKPLWNGLTNIKPYEFDFATNHQQVIESFNINTNDWAKRYVYKRLIFLNNRHLSSLGTLLFLAIWHGFAIGYFICFSLEFIYMEAEKRYQQATKSFVTSIENKPIPYQSYCFFCWICRSFAMNYAYVPFEMKTWKACLNAMTGLYWYGTIICVSIIVVTQVLPKPKSDKKVS